MVKISAFADEVTHDIAGQIKFLKKKMLKFIFNETFKLSCIIKYHYNQNNQKY